MKKIQLCLSIPLLLLGLSACPGQDTANNINNNNKNVVNVNIDEKLLEAIRGKTGIKETPGQEPKEPVVPREPREPVEPKEPVEHPEPDFEVDTEIEEQIFATISANADAVKDQDMESYFDSFHPESPFVSDFDAFSEFFALLVGFETSYDIFELEVEEITETTAAVYVNTDIYDRGGVVEKELLYTMRKAGGTWKIFLIGDY